MAGRPPKYETPEEMQRIIDLYFLACKVHQTGNTDLLKPCSDEDLWIINDIDDGHPTISGLAYTLGMSTEALRNYEAKEEFLATVKKAKQRVEMYLAQNLFGANVTGVIFNLKNNHGWKDKTEQAIDLTSAGKPVNNWTMVGVPAGGEPAKTPEPDSDQAE
jgi:hypothetical protein